MIAPLYDSRGAVRYFLGAQVDVSGLAKDCVGLESLRRLVEQSAGRDGGEAAPGAGVKKDEFRDLAEMFNLYELDTVCKHGGTMHRQPADDTLHHHHQADPSAPAPLNGHRPRILIHDSATSIPRPAPSPSGGRLAGVYEHYLLVRPYPSLRVLFASPSLRVPGMLQSSFLARVGGSQRVRDELTRALADGHGVTARVRWLARPAAATAAQQAGGGGPGSGPSSPAAGRPRWIHCTPLLAGGTVGAWMVVIVDEDGVEGSGAGLPARPRTAPPVKDARVVRTASSHLRAPALDDAASLRSFGDGGGGRVGLGLREAVGEGQRFRGAAGLRGGRGEAVAGVFDDTRPDSSYSWEVGED